MSGLDAGVSDLVEPVVEIIIAVVIIVIVVAGVLIAGLLIIIAALGVCRTDIAGTGVLCEIAIA